MSDAADRLLSAFSQRHFRDALGSFATGVTIVTTLDASGAPVGLTVNSFASVSLQPPLVLWSLVHTASTRQTFLTSSHFAINVLAADQLVLAQRFATRGIDRFANLATVAAPSGAPLLPDALAWFDCRRFVEHEAGDHTIFIGEVEHLGYRGANPRELPVAAPQQRPQALAPLIYHRGVLHQGGMLQQEKAPAPPPDSGGQDG